MTPETALFGGIRIYTSKWISEGGEKGYPDWRARLNRNLSRPSTGKWEPLTYPVPNVFLIGGDFYAHPKTVAAMRAVMP